MFRFLRKGFFSNAQGREFALLGAGTEFQGKLRFRGALRIDGHVKGQVYSEPNSESVLTLNRNSSLRGNITTDVVLINGVLEGKVEAHQRTELYRHAVLKSDLHTREIFVQQGARFEGSCHMRKDPVPVRTGPENAFKQLPALVSAGAVAAENEKIVPNEENVPKRFSRKGKHSEEV